MRQALKPNDLEQRLQALEADADARRARIASDVDELSWRMQPANLLAEAREGLMREIDRATDALVDMAGDLVDDAVGFARSHSRAIGAGTAITLLAGAAAWIASRRLRRQPVPLYDAYHMEDFDMNDQDDSLRQRAAGTWTKVKQEASLAGHKAGETYYAARSRAAYLTADARDKAGHAAEALRERAADAAASAREATEAASEWARQRPQENPLGTVAAAITLGVLVGVLLPSRNR